MVVLQRPRIHFVLHLHSPEYLIYNVDDMVRTQYLSILWLSEWQCITLILIWCQSHFLNFLFTENEKGQQRFCWNMIFRILNLQVFVCFWLYHGYTIDDRGMIVNQKEKTENTCMEAEVIDNFWWDKCCK